GSIIFDKSSITTKNSNPDTDRRTEERSKIKRYAIINVEGSGQGIDNGIIPTLFTKYFPINPWNGFWAVFGQKNHRSPRWYVMGTE
ncbi:MAG: hypothetical protein M3Q77_06585, partial [Thermoproteota archaeon]|nr:hypothetical protein [Thermoproteota archaeon]